MSHEKTTELHGTSSTWQALPEAAPATPRQSGAAPVAGPAPGNRENTATRRWFTFDGREYRLEMRRESPFWTLSFESKGKTVKHSTKTTNGVNAEKNAVIFLKARRDNDATVLTSLRSRADTKTVCASLGEVFAVVPQLPIDAGQATRNSYIWSMRWVLKRAFALADDAAVDKLSTEVLTDATAQRFFELITTESGQMDPSKAETFKRTAVTFFDNSRALFAPRALRAMKKTLNLALPDLADWRVGKLHAPKTTDKSEFVPPSEAMLRRMYVEWVKLGRTPGYCIPTCEGESHGFPLNETHRRNMFIAVGLALSFGFRKGDTIRACWNWFDKDEAGPLARVTDITQKNRQTTLEVSAVDPFYKILNFWVNKNGWRGRPEEPCLIARPKTDGDYGKLEFSEGGKCDREYWPFLLVGKWLRWLGWTSQKTNHSLRDLVASKLTMKYGLDVTKDWCRHAQQATTERHYSRFKSRAQQLNAKKLLWLRWAK